MFSGVNHCVWPVQDLDHSCAVYNEHVNTVAPRNYCRQSIMLFCFWFLIARWVNILNLTVIVWNNFVLKVIIFGACLKISFNKGRQYERGDSFQLCSSGGLYTSSPTFSDMSHCRIKRLEKQKMFWIVHCPSTFVISTILLLCINCIDTSSFLSTYS